MEILSPPFSPTLEFFERKGLIAQDRVSSYVELLPNGTKPELFLKVHNNQKTSEELDVGIISYLARFPEMQKYDFEKVLKGEKSLPLTHSIMSDKAWELGLPGFFPIRKDLHRNDDPKFLNAVDFAAKALRRTFYPFLANQGFSTHDEMMEDINLKSSTGYGMKRIYANKQEFFSDPTAVESVRDYWEYMTEPGAEDVFYEAARKDELREEEKAIKPRVYCVGPVHHNCVATRALRKQRNALSRVGLISPSAIGMRQTNLDFNVIMEQLTIFRHLLELDAKKWDGSQEAFVLVHVMLFRWDCMPLKERTFRNWCILFNVYAQMIRARLIFPDGGAFPTFGSMKSGYAATADDNTFAHYFVNAFVYAYNGGSSYSDFSTFIKMKLYGDDITASYSERIAIHYNVDLVIETAKIFNITYENANPTWDNVHFLGHRIVKFCDVWVPVRAYDSVLSGWVMGGDGTWRSSIERSAAYRVQAYFHPHLFQIITDYMIYTLNRFDPSYKSGFWGLLVPEDDIRDLHLHS